MIVREVEMADPYCEKSYDCLTDKRDANGIVVSDVIERERSYD